MTQSNGSQNAGKPAKPHPDFPLFPHATKRWAKKVRGEFHFFGPWRDPDAALNEWLRVKDDLLAGRKVHWINPVTFPVHPDTFRGKS